MNFPRYTFYFLCSRGWDESVAGGVCFQNKCCMFNLGMGSSFYNVSVGNNTKLLMRRGWGFTLLLSYCFLVELRDFLSNVFLRVWRAYWCRLLYLILQVFLLVKRIFRLVNFTNFLSQYFHVEKYFHIMILLWNSGIY